MKMRILIVLAVLLIGVVVGVKQGFINIPWGGGASTAGGGDSANTPASGMAHGVRFTVEKASLQGGILRLRQGKEFFADQEFMIFTFLKKGEGLAGKTFVVKPEDMSGSPHIHFKYRVAGSKLPKTEMYTKGYTMMLVFGTASGKTLPGKINLHLPDTMKSYVVGTFVAEIK